LDAGADITAAAGDIVLGAITVVALRDMVSPLGSAPVFVLAPPVVRLWLCVEPCPGVAVGAGGSLAAGAAAESVAPRMVAGAGESGAAGVAAGVAGSTDAGAAMDVTVGALGSKTSAILMGVIAPLGAGSSHLKIEFRRTSPKFDPNRSAPSGANIGL
jgi:hypothetical protein